MPSAYAGDKTHTQAPSAKPGPEGTITGNLPVDGDLPNASTWLQAFKVCLDWIDWLLKPQGNTSLTTRWLQRWRTAVGHTRFSLDRLGMPGAQVMHWQEWWPIQESISLTSVNGLISGYEGRGWRVRGTSGGAGIITLQMPSGNGVSSADQGYAKLQAGSPLNEAVGIQSGSPSRFIADADIAVESLIYLSSAAMVNEQVVWGPAAAMATDPTVGEGLVFTRIPGAANWQALSIGPSNNTLVDTGVAAVATTWTRFRIEYRGTNVNDGGVATAYFFIDGVRVATITTNLPTDGAGVLWAFKNLTGSSSSNTARMSVVNYACNIRPNVT